MMNQGNLLGKGSTHKLVSLFMATALVTAGCGANQSKDCTDKHGQQDPSCKEEKGWSSGGSTGGSVHGTSGISSGKKSKGGVGGRSSGSSGG
ncbi:hypothetical protein JOD24_001274 [Kroppenstedtia sanguinis]|uniref:hypothetical protein n=1 Tax=Kroppenstedtia sanguinis TaxID=1380684 RepID=UPI003D2325C8